MQLGAEAGAEHYHAAVRARINAATLVPLLNTSNDLARRVELYLKELNMTTEFLNRLPDEINALLRSGPDTMDTPRFREVAVNVLAEIVADAKAQGIDTSGVESRINLSLSGYWPLRSKLAALDRPGRIGALVKMLVESKHSYSRIVVQALANEGPAIIGPVTQQLRDLAKCRNEPRDRLEAVNGLTYTLAVLGDPAAIPVLERLADSNDDPKNIVSFSCRSTAKHLRRGFRFVLEPDY